MYGQLSSPKEKIFGNFKCAGAAVEFETNKGRVFSYQPIAMTTGRKSKQVTCKVDPGKEIISLNIEKGVLTDLEQQYVPESDKVFQSKNWFIVGSTGQKEDLDERFLPFYNQKDALTEYKKTSTHATSKKGYGAVIIDAMNMSVWKKTGETEAIMASSRDADYWCQKKE